MVLACFDHQLRCWLYPQHLDCQTVWVCVQLLSLCLSLSDPVDCSPPDSSVRGTLQASILEWVAVPSSRGIFPTLGLNLSLLDLLILTEGWNSSLLNCGWILYR